LAQNRVHFPHIGTRIYWRCWGEKCELGVADSNSLF
jgi:hypothetical protein